MSIISKVVIRCDAGIKYGLGHLSRCYTLFQEFINLNTPIMQSRHRRKIGRCDTLSQGRDWEDTIEAVFIVRTDAEDLVKEFIESKNFKFRNFTLHFIESSVSQQEDLELISNCVSSYNNTLLVLDHYEITDQYQLFLSNKKIKWLQFDSHAKINLYANWVLHGSPAATEKLYSPLVKDKNVKLLLGTDYAIIKLEVIYLGKRVRIRKEIKQIIICFGGGDDYGATLKCLNFIDSELVKDIAIKVSVNSKNKDFEKICKALYKFKNSEIILNERLSFEMSISDVAFIAPGMISYESAYLALPMFLITTSDNQNINAIGWVEKKCAIYLGDVGSVSQEELNKNLEKIILNKEILKNMSINCSKTVDGLGAKRIKKIILNKDKI